MCDYEKLKVLCGIATQGERYVQFEYSYELDEIGRYSIDVHPCEGYFAVVEDITPNAAIDAHFIAEARPETILAIITELEKLKAVNFDYQMGADAASSSISRFQSENEALRDALVKIIEMNRQHAEDQYGDPDKAESWSCVTVAREAMSREG